MKKSTRKIVNRNGKYPCDICKESNILHSHHINGRDIPNANDFFNISNLCPNCHYNCHYGNLIIEKWVMTSNGYELLWHKKGEESITGEDSHPNLLIPSDLEK